MAKRCFLFVAAVLITLSFVSNHNVGAKDSWISVRSENFLLIGNGSEKEIRQVGERLEQFREAISRMFTNIVISSPVPTTVIVFKNDSSYRPFKVSPNNAGFFQAGPDVNYITLTTESRGFKDPFSIILHEYTHLLVNNTIGDPPTWFNEGLAEYYSTFSVTDDQKVVVGRPIPSHIFFLRRNTLLPLRTLFKVDHKSPYYNEELKQSIFYAQSWALMHFLIFNKNDERASQMGKFLELMSAKVPMEQAFERAFQTTFEAMERELHDYIRQDRFRVMEQQFEQKLGVGREMRATPISEAEALSYLGDLLLHCNRDDAETYLQRALLLDPDLATAHSSLGVLRFRQGRHEEARTSLERAVAANSQNYLIRYYYAYVLGRPGADMAQFVSGYSTELAAKIRSELKTAIALRPDFPESYNLLAYVNLVTNTDIEESISLIQKALTRSPGRIDFTYMLGQLYMNRDDYKAARPLLEKVVVSDAEERTRQHAQKLVETIVAIEEELARRPSRKLSLKRGDSAGSDTGNADQEESDPSSDLREVLRTPGTGETQVQGLLVRVDCEPKAFVFVVKVGADLIKLRSESFEKVGLVSFDPGVKGHVTCGPRNPENSVVVNYQPTSDKRLGIGGLLRSIEFVPAHFKLKP